MRWKRSKKKQRERHSFWFAGSDKGALAQFYDQLATPLLITDDRRNEKALENGTFDWSDYTLLAETFKEMQEKQLINKDILTAKPSQLVELMAQEKSVLPSQSRRSALIRGKSIQISS